MDLGFVKLHRQLTDWEWYTYPNMVQFFIHCLLRANHKAGNFQGIQLEAGQFVSGRKKLSLQTGLSEQNIRTCIKNLVLTNELTTVNNGINTIFTINSWKSYQSFTDPNNELTKQSTNYQPRPNQALTTNKNEKNEKNEKNNNYAHFERFWTMYDKKSDRSRCQSKFNKLNDSEIESIFRVLPFYIQSTPDVTFRKNPLTWLNGKCWLDIEDSKQNANPKLDFLKGK